MNTHDLKLQKVLLIEPRRWAAAIQLAQTTMPMSANPDLDIFGEPLPVSEVTSDGIAIIPVCGIMAAGIPEVFKRFGFTDPGDIAAEIREAAENQAVKGIMLDVNSPGGSIQGIPELADLVAEVNKIKPTISFTQYLNASAAYWVSCGAAAQFATKTAEVGSIGAYVAIEDCTKAFEIFGIKMEIFKSGKFKGMGIQGTSLNDEQRAAIQADVESIAAMFKSHVERERKGISSDAMQGQTFMGEKAVSAKLVDKVATGFDEAYDELLMVVG